MKLPEFDRVQKVSLSAHKAYPPGYGTLISMPALISGRRLSSVNLDDCNLILTLDDTGVKTNWSDLPSVFSQARQLGVNSALVGWFLPYDRVLGGSLSYCSWYIRNPPLWNLSNGDDLRCLAAQQQELLWPGFFNAARWKLFIDACKASLKDGLAAIADPSFGLILLHLPPPHDPAVYVAEKNEFTP